jgi:hypothetical protein
VIDSRQTLHLADYRADRAYVEGEPVAVAGVELGGIRTLLIVPMLKDDELVGAFGIYRQEVQPFTDKQIELVQNFAAQAVIAIENTRLLNELRQRTDDLTSRWSSRRDSEVLKVISSSPGELEPCSRPCWRTRPASASEVRHAVPLRGRVLRMSAAIGRVRRCARSAHRAPCAPGGTASTSVAHPSAFHRRDDAEARPACRSSAGAVAR